jgi:hypothetical protein
MTARWHTATDADKKLSPAAKALAAAITSRFVAQNPKYATFHDAEAGRLIGLEAVELQTAKYELMQRGYLRQLHSRQTPASYVLELP